MADQVTEIEAALGRSRAARGREERPPLPKVLDNLPVVDPSDYAQPYVRLDKLEKDITKPVQRLQQLAIDLSGLNFGEMMEFSTGSGGDAQKIWDWSVEYLAKDMKAEPK